MMRRKGHLELNGEQFSVCKDEPEERLPYGYVINWSAREVARFNAKEGQEMYLYTVFKAMLGTDRKGILVIDRSKLEKQIGIAKNHISTLTKQLEKKGLIKIIKAGKRIMLNPTIVYKGSKEQFEETLVEWGKIRHEDREKEIEKTDLTFVLEGEKYNLKDFRLARKEAKDVYEYVKSKLAERYEWHEEQKSIRKQDYSIAKDLIINGTSPEHAVAILFFSSEYSYALEIEEALEYAVNKVEYCLDIIEKNNNRSKDMGEGEEVYFPS